MKDLKLKIKRLLNRLITFKRKEKLPQGVSEFYEWSTSIITSYGLPENDSIRFALATIILHSKEDAAFLSKEYFGIRLLKSAANQVAAGVMQDLKQKQAEQMAAEEKAKNEATAALAAVTNESQA